MLAASDNVYDATALFTRYGMSIADGMYTGTEADDNIWGKQRDDLIDGGEGKNSVHGGYGGYGNDTMIAGNGNDTVFGDAGDDVIRAGEGINTVYGGTGNDTITTGTGNDTLDGDEGNDTINSGDGDDSIAGGEGDDFLHSGQYGIDTLEGGAGADLLEGGYEDDTYFFTKGANNTVIEDKASTGFLSKWFTKNGGKDTILFGEGINKKDINFFMKGENLLLQYGDNEFISINNQKSKTNRIERLQLDDGSYITNTEPIAKITDSISKTTPKSKTTKL